MKCSVFKYEQTRALQSVAGINNKTFGDEPLKVDALLGARCLGGSNSGGLKWSLTSFSTSKAEGGNAFIRRGLEVNWLTKSWLSLLLSLKFLPNGKWGKGNYFSENINVEKLSCPQAPLAFGT